jgi:hypothetical protein
MGPLLDDRKLMLKEGTIQIDFFSGATAVIEGPATFQPLSSMSMRFEHGKIRLRVPDPAVGFKLLTMDGEIVDLGTEFALALDGDDSELHVFDGEIEWHPKNSAMKRMRGGDGLKWSDGTPPATFVSNRQGFVGVEEIESQARLNQEKRLAKWNESRGRWLADRRLVFAYDFDQFNRESTEKRLRDVARSAQHLAIEAALVGELNDRDRWGQPEGAIDFSRAGSRARLRISRSFKALTLSCWLKVNSLDRTFNSLLLTDSFDPGEPHWQILEDGRAIFVIRSDLPNDIGKYAFHSPVIWKLADTGRWLMLSVTCDTERGEVIHYLNGEEISHEKIPEAFIEHRLNFGPSSLGNWDLPIREDPWFAIRNLNGSLDDFFFFETSLAPDEMRSLYVEGKP